MLYSIDATMDKRLGKFVNDSPNAFCNAKMKLHVLDGQPHLLLYAIKDIPSGTEIRYENILFFFFSIFNRDISLFLFLLNMTYFIYIAIYFLCL